MEANLQREYEQKQLEKKEAKLKKPTARKSTAKSRAESSYRPTARKSTTVSSRGGHGEFSYYGIPQDPVDFNDISTRMSIGGMEITLNASKLAGMVNLKPIIRVKDCETR